MSLTAAGASFGTESAQVRAKPFMGSATVAPGLTLVRSLPSGWAAPNDLTSAKGILYFVAADAGSASGPTIWTSDGTTAGTREVVHGSVFEVPGDVGRDPRQLTDLAGTVYFNTGDRLWRSDGTAAGTIPLTDMPPVSAPTFFEPFGNQLAFVGPDQEVWLSDGTSAGTRRIADTTPDPSSYGSNPSGAASWAGGLYWSGASNGSFGDGRALFRSDGTPTGVSKVLSGDVGNLTPAAHHLFFTTFDQTSREQSLWTTGGSAESTEQIATARFNSNARADIGSVTAVGEGVYFTMNSTAGGYARALWRSDGTSSGTSLVVDLGPGLAGDLGDTGITNLTPVGGQVFFNVADVSGLDELWVTDGTTAGTGRLTVDATGLMVHRGALYFTGQDATGGGLWTSDGTTGGTRRVDHIAWRPTAPPVDLTSTGADLFMTGGRSGAADQRQVGIWKLDETPGRATSVKVPRQVRVSSTVRIPVTITPGEATAAVLNGTVRLGKGKPIGSLKRVQMTLEAGARQRVLISVPKKAARRIMAAIRAFRTAPRSARKRLQVRAVLVVQIGTPTRTSIRRVIKLR